MKTAVSLPDTLFQQAEVAARKSKVSRSQLYATALEEYLRRQRDAEITANLNEVYSREPAPIDPAFERAQFEAIGREPW